MHGYKIKDIPFFSGNARPAEKSANPFLVLPELLSGHGGCNDISAVVFRSGVARLERREDTVSADEEIVVGMVGDGEEASKSADRANRSEGKRDGSVQHAFDRFWRSESDANGIII